jgi:nucleoid DNA-binding protein
MDKHIVALLNSNLRVIIPDFGAFIIRQREPKITVFNEFFTQNDGILIDFIIKTEGIDDEMARQQLSEYTSNASKILDSGSVLTIEGLGKLKKENSGKIVFTADDEINNPEISQAVKGLTVMQLDEDDAETAPTSKPKTKVVPKTKARPASDLSPTVISEIPPEVPEKTVDVIPPAPPEPKPVVIAPEVKNIPAATATDKTPNPVLQADLIDDSVGIRPNKVLKWILIFLLVNSAVIAFFVFHDNKQNWFHRNKETMGIMDSVLEQLADSVRAAAADTALVFSEAAKTEAIDESRPPSGNLRYYIVAGCFRDSVKLAIFMQFPLFHSAIKNRQ